MNDTWLAPAPSAPAARVLTMGPVHSASDSGLYSWREVVWHVRSAGRVLSRSLAMEDSYQVHRRRLRATGRSTTDDVLGLFRSPASEFAFAPAAFPYALAPHIGHWILWVRRGSYDAWLRETGPAAEVSRQVRRVYGLAAASTTFVQNLAGERSIESVPHYHVFVVNASGGAPLRWDLRPEAQARWREERCTEARCGANAARSAR